MNICWTLTTWKQLAAWKAEICNETVSVQTMLSFDEHMYPRISAKCSAPERYIRESLHYGQGAQNEGIEKYSARKPVSRTKTKVSIDINRKQLAQREKDFLSRTGPSHPYIHRCP